MTTFGSLLVANRGEIVMRVARTARRLGLRTIAVHSDADRDAPHVRACDDSVALGGTLPADSYLRIDRVLGAARAAGAAAVHPGYGFLSESAAFAQAVVDAGLVFVGPPVAAMRAMGDKIEARRRAAALGVPVLPGCDPDASQAENDADLARAAHALGFPLMVKAAAGGGGRGMRLVHDAAALGAALASARAEAQGAFGDGRLLLERALTAPRHVEIQVLADAHGNVVHLGERDCSVQRRHQKIVEEAPCPALTPALRRQMGAAAVALARAIGYVGAGTVEFLLEGRTAAPEAPSPLRGDDAPASREQPSGQAFFFMEMNTRLQVEHPVTEALLGLDLVEWQLRIAAGERLPFAQDELLERYESGGHAVEARLCAEDPAAGFLPRGGRVSAWAPADDIRIDHAVEPGLAVGPYYDSLLGKLIASGPTRAAAVRALATALDRTVLLGVATNRAFLARVLRHPAFLAGDVSTAFVEQHFGDAASRAAPPDDACWALAALIVARYTALPLPREWRNWSSSGVRTSAFRLAHGDEERRGTVDGREPATVRLEEVAIDVAATAALAAQAWNTAIVNGRRVSFWFEQQRNSLWLQVRGADGAIDALFVDRGRQASTRAGASDDAGTVAAPMHGRVAAIAVRVGERVAAGAPLATLEAMKMEHALIARAAGTVCAVHVRVGDQVATGRVLVEIRTGSGAG